VGRWLTDAFHALGSVQSACQCAKAESSWRFPAPRVRQAAATGRALGHSCRP